MNDTDSPLHTDGQAGGQCGGPRLNQPGHTHPTPLPKAWSFIASDDPPDTSRSVKVVRCYACGRQGTARLDADPRQPPMCEACKAQAERLRPKR